MPWPVPRGGSSVVPARAKAAPPSDQPRRSLSTPFQAAVPMIGAPPRPALIVRQGERIAAARACPRVQGPRAASGLGANGPVGG